jgi:erythromycin esterase
MPQGVPERARAIADLRLLRQHADIYQRSMPEVVGRRDAALAANLLAQLAPLPGGARVVLWAHDGHVATSPIAGGWALGAHLRDTLGADYAAVAMSFGEGRFQAHQAPADGPGEPGERGPMAAFEVGSPPADTFEALLDAGPPGGFALDLRALPDEARAPFLELRPRRGIGATYRPDWGHVTSPTRLAEAYQAVIHVRHAERARPYAP